MAEELVIETNDLRKTFGGVEALRGVDLAVPAGSICGFLGRNGAGKTTTLKVLLGMIRPTAGRARVFGLAADDRARSIEIRRRVGFVGEDKELYDSMSVEQIVRFTASFYPRWRPDLEQRYMRAFELPSQQKVKALSRGTRTKLALMLALCRGADLLMLDEPTSGLDPAVAEEVLQALVRHAANENLSIFFSSHQLSEIDQIADSVAVLDRGRTVLAGPLDELKERYRRIDLVFDGEAPAVAFHTRGVERVQRNGRVLSVLSSAGSDAVVDEARALAPHTVQVEPVTLKQIFLETVAPGD